MTEDAHPSSCKRWRRCRWSRCPACWAVVVGGCWVCSGVWGRAAVAEASLTGRETGTEERRCPGWWRRVEGCPAGSACLEARAPRCAGPRCTGCVPEGWSVSGALEVDGWVRGSGAGCWSDAWVWRTAVRWERWVKSGSGWTGVWERGWETGMSQRMTCGSLSYRAGWGEG